MSQIHICGRCKAEFDSEEAYNGHTCPETGVTPADPEHHGEEFLAVQEAALKRGEERKGEKVHPAAAAEKAAKTGK